MFPFSHSVLRKFCAILMLMCFAGSVQAAEWTSLRMGYEGIGKVGKWLPIRIAASGLPNGEIVELQAAFSDPRGDTCVQTVASGTVNTDGVIELSGSFCAGRLAGSALITIVTRSSGEILCRKNVVHSEDADPADPNVDVQTSLKLYKLDVPLLLTIGQVAGIEELQRNADMFSQNRSILVGISLASLAELPDDERGLDAIDLILLSDEFATTDQQAEAIKQWVRSGGNLFVTAGANVTELLQSSVGKWIGDYFEIQPEATTMRDLSSLQSFVSGASRLETNRRTVSMAVMISSQNVNVVNSLNGPIVSAQSVGAGVVTVVAVDLNKRPISRWVSLPQLYEVLFFGEKLSKKTSLRSRSSRISQSGVSDLATQMMATIDATPQTGSWSTWSIMAMMVCWLLLIGPVDYYLVTHLLKRPHLTWFTFPLLIVAGVSVVFAGLGNNTITQLNQLHIVDILEDGTHEHMSVRSWMSVSSPNTMKSTLTATPADLVPDAGPCSLMWSGRPEDVYGGMYRSGGIGLGKQSYMHRFDTPNTLTGIPLLTDGSRQLIAEWQRLSDTPIVTSDLVVSGYGLLRGTFSHNLAFPLTDFIVIHGNRVYRTSEISGSLSLAPGQVWDSREDSVAASDLKGFLNGSRLVKIKTTDSNRGSSQEITPYNAGSTDLQYILTMATFYKVAGGPKYLGLSQEMLKKMELSDTIRLNHAVVIGLIDAPATSLQMDQTMIEPTRSTSLVRLLLPVNRRPSAKQAQTQQDLDRQADQKKQQRSND